MNKILDRLSIRPDQIRKEGTTFKRTVNLIWNASGTLTVTWAALLLVQGVLPGVAVYLTKHGIDALVIAIGAGGEWIALQPALILLGAIVLVMLLSDVFQSLLEIVRATQADIIQDHVKSLVHSKCGVADMAHFESSEYHDRLEQATSDGASRPLSLLESIGGVVQNSITLIVMAGLMLQYSIWLPAILLLSTLPAFLIILRFDRVYHRWWKQTTAERRWIQYFDIMLVHSRAVAEVRAFGLNPVFQEKYQAMRKKLRLEKLSQMRRLSVAKLSAAILSLIVLGAALMWTGSRVLHGALTLGDLALFYQAFTRGQGLMKTLLNSLGQMIKNSLFVRVLFEFLDLDSEISDPKEPVSAPRQLKEGIHVDNVTFRYPGTERAIFKDLSLFVPAGKSVAIVGENGSGKTTLIKLICRFYDAESGSVKLDGIDIRRFSVRELLEQITITFQMPLNYHATVSESISMGDLNTLPSPAAVEAAARSAGAHDFISQLPNGYETLLGKVHANGAELSGGEWQRLALARAYYRKAPIVLLDEPTSFMDSWSEGDWFRRFRELTHGQTALVITHRFTIAMRADLIIVMDKGRIVEQGTHSELLRMNGLYARSWNEQMRTAAFHGEVAGPSKLEVSDISRKLGIDRALPETTFTSKL